MMDRAIQMACDLAERERALLIVFEMLEAMKTEAVERRAEVAKSWLHARLLREMCDYKDRMDKQIESLLRETMAVVKQKAVEAK